MMTMQTHEGMDVILDHFSNPRNYGGFEDPDIDVEGSNPGCGDVIRMQAHIGQAYADGEGVIRAVRFTGNGCTVSIAAASLLTTLLEGRTIEEAMRVPDQQILDSLEASLSPRRYACALLGYRLLRKGMVEYYHSRRVRSGDSTS
jgi:nitrogen fixation NifU-like protein